MFRRSALVLAAAAGLAAAGLTASPALAADNAAPAGAGEPTTQQLLDQIKQLQNKVERLEAKQQQQQSANSAEVAATVDKIYQDAAKRSQLLQTEGMNILAGHENDRFFIRSEDGNYVLNPSFEVQIRNVSNYNTAGSDSFENGFEIRRFKMRFEGNAFSPNFTYAFQWATNQSNGNLVGEDAWVRYKLSDAWYVRGGQFKDPLLHEQLVSGRRQLAADRSLMSVYMTGSSDNYIQGVTAIYDKEGQPLRAEFGFTDGIGSVDTNWRDFPANNTNFGAAGRVEYFVYGDRKQYDDFTALGNKKELLVLGAAGDVTQAGGDTAYFHTLDAQWENTTGVTVYGAYLGRLLTSAGSGDTYDFGFEAEAGYLFRPRWELFGRYDLIKLDNAVTFASGGTEDTFHELTLGVNYYLHGHSAKFTVDGTYLPNGSPADQLGLGILGGDDAQFLLRAQFQFVL